MKQMKKNIIASIALASVAFGLAACGDDSSSGVSSEEVDVSLAGVVFTSDYTTGELRWIDKDGKISVVKSIKTGKFAYKGETSPYVADIEIDDDNLYVLEGIKADNITLVDPEKLESDGKKAVVWQASMDPFSNPIDLAFDGDEAWVALQAADSLVKISTGCQVH